MNHKWQDYESVEHSKPSDPAFFAGHDDEYEDAPSIQSGLAIFAVIKAIALVILCGIAALAIMATICM